MTDVLVRAARGTVAVIALVALVAIPPVLLAVAVGWPLPREMPSAAEVESVLRGGRVAAATVMKVLALIGWLAWLQLSAAIVAEVHGQIAARASARIPTAGLVQPLVARLVLAATLLTSGRAEPAHAEPVVADSAASEAPRLWASHAEPSSPATEPTREPAAELAVTVRPRDSLWALAERHLGDGLRWREIWALNQGATFDDGRVFRDPDLIRPGWTLKVPEDAVGLQPPPAPTPTRGPTAQPLDGVDPAPVPHEHASRAVPDLPAGTRAEFEAEDAGESGDPEQEGSRPVVPAALAGGSLLAAGIVAALGRLRAAQLRNRAAGTAPPPPSEATRRTETRLRQAAAEARPDRLDLVLRGLAAQLSSQHVAPAIDAVLVGADEAEVLFAEAVTADPGPFTAEADGRAWVLRAGVDVDLIEPAASQGTPAPALATVAEVDGRQLLLDLEACATVAVTGDRTSALRLLWSVGYSLATSVWADDVEIVVIGDAPPGLARLDRVRQVDNTAEVLETVQKAASTARDELVDRRLTSTLGARLATPSDPWTPTVFLVPNPDQHLAELITAVREGAGFAAVAITEGGDGFDTTLTADCESVQLSPLGIQGEVLALPAEIAGDVDELLRLSADSDARPTLLDSASGGRGLPAESDQDVLRVRVLGPVEIVGGKERIDRRRSQELFVYLALHADGVDESRLRASLWPNSAPSLHLLNQTISRARSALGQASDGTLYLPRQSDGRYHPGVHVHTDAALLEEAYRQARAEPSEDTMAALRDALRDVRGLPFEGTSNGWEWVHTEGIGTRLSALISDAAHCLAGHALDHGDPQTAIWAARQGLLGAPGDEILYRDWMLAQDAQGNLAGVKAVMDELLAVVDDLEPYDAVHPTTLDLYERLVGRGTRKRADLGRPPPPRL